MTRLILIRKTLPLRAWGEGFECGHIAAPDSRDFCGPNCGLIGHSEIAATKQKKQAVAAR
jgi:hypothetical protein